MRLQIIMIRVSFSAFFNGHWVHCSVHYHYRTYNVEEKMMVNRDYTLFLRLGCGKSSSIWCTLLHILCSHSLFCNHLVCVELTLAQDCGRNFLAKNIPVKSISQSRHVQVEYFSPNKQMLAFQHSWCTIFQWFQLGRKIIMVWLIIKCD